MKYIPQAPPFEMIDRLITVDEQGVITTELTIQASNVLVADGVFSTAGLIENMAQTAASGVGFEAFNAGRKPEVGFIGAIKSFQVSALPKVGEHIATVVTPITQIGHVQVVQGAVYLNAVTIASAEFKIFLQES